MGELNAAKTLITLGALMLLGGLLILIAGPREKPTSLHIAAASSLRATLPQLVDEYTKSNPGFTADVTYAASGTLAASIERGAPYDLFLSADETRPTHLNKLGLLTPAGVQPFATSRVVLIRRIDPNAPEAPASPKLAIPNPAFAPFGQAAALWLDTRPDFGPHTLIFADSVANAAGLYRAGAVDGAFVDSQHAAAYASTGEGLITELDGAPPITLTAAVMKTSIQSAEAERFVAFLRQQWNATEP